MRQTRFGRIRPPALLTLVTVVPLAALISMAGSAWVANQGTDAQKTHVPVTLKDEAGLPIDPSAPDARPYSPRATCGGCHPYDAITKAYHFTMGADVIADDWGAKHRNRPWMSSPGQNGGQQHMSYAWLSKKRNSRADEVGMTPYVFARTCAVCHPGGSIFEHDRDGQRYDHRMARQPNLADSVDGDYYKTDWQRSGVLEADCLMCHSQDYDPKARAAQLAKSNYRWAATVGAGLGAVEGSVADGQTPRLTYRADLASASSIRVVPSKTTDKNCLFCHAEAETKKRGHVWDGRNEDVHGKFACTTCHTTSADHQIRKGRSNAVFLHDEMDDPTLSCKGCHSTGRLGAKKPRHATIQQDHLEKLACVVCHVRDANVTAVHVVDTTTGASVGIPTNREGHKYGESKPWQPAYFRLRNGQISVGNALLPSWWGMRVGTVIHPLTFAETAKAFQLVKHRIGDDNGDGKPEANSEEEIRAMLEAIAETMRGGRLAVVSPAYVKGHEVWEIRGGRLTHGPHPQASPLRWTFSHNVSRASRALGAGGCTDCHGKTGGVFGTSVTVDPWGPNGNPVSIPVWKYLGLQKPDPYGD